MTKELSDWLRREGANCQKHIDCADALERLTTERDAYKGMYEAAHAMRGDAEVEALKAEAENAALREGLDGWHARFLDCEVEFARLVDVCHAAKLILATENAALKEQMTADRKQFLDMRNERDALAQTAERVRVYKQRYFGAIAERDAGLKYTAWQSPHNDDLWLEHPADCDIIDNFHPPVHVGFEYELTAGSYTTQRYRVVKIADAESDDVLVELIAGEKT